jgi:hypothetical protein
MLLFFDGEEAFLKWGPKDSLYGARHLAEKWNKQKYIYGSEKISGLDQIVKHFNRLKNLYKIIFIKTLFLTFRIYLYFWI